MPLQMPHARDFGWTLKPTGSTHFHLDRRENGQFTVVLSHSLLRGVTAEMIHWWFLHFANLRVLLDDVPGYAGQEVPAYLLWHPSDHESAHLLGDLGPGGVARAGAQIRIKEAMQYEKYGLRFPVDQALDIFYCADDGWAMGKSLPLIGKVMCLGISFRDVVENGEHLGVHYHYEVVVGASGNNPLVRALNGRITGRYPPEFFEAWHLHNSIEVGTFENFLPALYEQRDRGTLRYARAMDSAPKMLEPQVGHDRAFFEIRRNGLSAATDPFAYQETLTASHC